MLGAFAPDERPRLADLLDRFVASIDDFVAATATAAPRP